MPVQQLPQLQQFQAPNIMGGLATVENIKRSRQQGELNRMQMEQMPEQFARQGEALEIQKDTLKLQQDKLREDTKSAQATAENDYMKNQYTMVIDLLKQDNPELAKEIWNNNIVGVVPGADKVDKLESTDDGWEAFTSKGKYLIDKKGNIKEAKTTEGKPVELEEKETSDIKNYEYYKESLPEGEAAMPFMDFLKEEAKGETPTAREREMASFKEANPNWRGDIVAFKKLMSAKDADEFALSAAGKDYRVMLGQKTMAEVAKEYKSAWMELKGETKPIEYEYTATDKNGNKQGWDGTAWVEIQ